MLRFRWIRWIRWIRRIRFRVPWGSQTLFFTMILALFAGIGDLFLALTLKNLRKMNVFEVLAPQLAPIWATKCSRNSSKIFPKLPSSANFSKSQEICQNHKTIIKNQGFGTFRNCIFRAADPPKLGVCKRHRKKSSENHSKTRKVQILMKFGVPKGPPKESHFWF